MGCSCKRSKRRRPTGSHLQGRATWLRVPTPAAGCTWTPGRPRPMPVQGHPAPRGRQGTRARRAGPWVANWRRAEGGCGPAPGNPSHCCHCWRACTTRWCGRRAAAPHLQPHSCAWACGGCRAWGHRRGDSHSPTLPRVGPKPALQGGFCDHHCQSPCLPTPRAPPPASTAPPSLGPGAGCLGPACGPRRPCCRRCGCWLWTRRGRGPGCSWRRSPTQTHVPPSSSNLGWWMQCMVAWPSPLCDPRAHTARGCYWQQWPCVTWVGRVTT